MSQRVRIEVDVAYAESMVRLLDLAGRIHMGQLDEISSLANQGMILGRDRGTDEGVPLDREAVDRLEEIMISAKAVLGHPAGGSYGIGGRGVSIDAKRCYEVQKALAKAVHDHLRPDVRHVTDAVGLTVRYAQGEAPTAKVVTA